MPQFGVTPDGFVVPTLQELIGLVEADQLAEVSAQLDFSPGAPLERLNNIYMRYGLQPWQALGTIYGGFDPDKAANVMLTMLSKLTGTPRPRATQSIVACSLTCKPGTKLVSGTHFASVAGSPDVKFTPQTDFVAVDPFTTGVLFVSEKTGPIEALAGALTVIATPVIGWTDIDNPLSAAVGSDVATDPQLRVRRQQELTQSGSGTIDAIRSKVVALLADIEGSSVTGFNNPSDGFDVNRLPPHSFEIVVWDPSHSITNDQIAQVIYNANSAGVPAFGTTSGTALDSKGTAHSVAFSRATEVPIFVEYTLAPKVNFIGNDPFRAAVFMACAEGITGTGSNGATTVVLEPYKTGTPVTLYDLTVATQGLGAEVSAVTFGTTPSPTTSTTIAIGTRQIATFDFSRITVA